jgi:DNA-binding MarR family transcriptional regulator
LTPSTTLTAWALSITFSQPAEISNLTFQSLEWPTVTRTIQEIGLSVKRLQVRHHRASDSELAPLGISLVQWDALRHLDQNPGASLHDLAQLTFQTDQSFGTLAGRMIERGLIERVDGPGRAVRHRLTEKGRKLRRAGEQVVGSVLSRSFAPLTPQQLATFDKLLIQLLSSPK